VRVGFEEFVVGVVIAVDGVGVVFDEAVGVANAVKVVTEIAPEAVLNCVEVEGYGVA